MKEYRIVCDIVRTNQNGLEITKAEQYPYGSSGATIGHHPFHDKSEAKIYLEKYIEWGKEFIRKEEINRKHYPDLYEKIELKNYKIMSREVTEWKPEP